MAEVGLVDLSAALREIAALEKLPSLAARAAGLIGSAPGPATVAHRVLLAMSGQADVRELAPEQWAAILGVAEALADLCDDGAAVSLPNRLGVASRTSLSPPSVH